MTQVVRQIVQEKNTTAIVREENPAIVKRWDNDIIRLKREHAANNRVSALHLAISVLRDDPDYSSFNVKIDNSITNSITDTGTNTGTTQVVPRDFLDDDVLPLADRIYNYITQDEEN